MSGWNPLSTPANKLTGGKGITCTKSQECHFPSYPRPQASQWVLWFLFYFLPPRASHQHHSPTPSQSSPPKDAQTLAMWVRNALSMLYLNHITQDNRGNELHHLNYAALISPFYFVSLHEEIFLRVTHPISTWEIYYKGKSTSSREITSHQLMETSGLVSALHKMSHKSH